VLAHPLDFPHCRPPRWGTTRSGTPSGCIKRTARSACTSPWRHQDHRQTRAGPVIDTDCPSAGRRRRTKRSHRGRPRRGPRPHGL